MSEQECTHVTRSISLSTFFDLLSHPHRRAVLAILLDNDRELTTNNLTKAIAVRNHETPITEIPGEEVENLRLSLIHSHIPKLAETPLIEYDERRQIVKPAEPLEEFEPVLSKVAEADTANQLFTDSVEN